MTSRTDLELDDSLWDPGAPTPAELRRIEQALVPLRFDPSEAPLPLGQPRPRRAWPRRLWQAALGVAAAFLVLVGFATFRWSWPEGRPWPMTVVAADGSSRATQLEVDRPLDLGPGDSARVQVARIGAIEVSAGSTLTLKATTATRHRLVLTRGAVRARVWAPPASVIIKTPAGDVIDLGCLFRLSVDADGGARVAVESGWVQLDNLAGETLVPAGASSEMARGGAPLVPVFDDAEPSFRAGVRALEAGLAADLPPEGAPGFLSQAREKDVITLLDLVPDAPPGVRRTLLDRAAVLSPPPSGVSLGDIVQGDRDALWRWHGVLKLPPPKSWWLHWRDGFERPR